MIVRHEQVNARGEGSRPRVDLIALARCWTAPPWASRCCDCDSGPRGKSPGRRPLSWRETLSLRFGKSGRSGLDRGAAFRATAPGDDPMQVTVTIHEAWLARSDDLRRVMARLAGLEVPPPPSGGGPRQNAPAPAPDPEDYETPFYPERGDAWEPPAEEPDQADDPDAPTSGRQLLGWAAKQEPDAKPVIVAYGKAHGLASRVVEWTAEQVAAAYRFARSQGAAAATPAPRRDDGPYKPRYSNGELHRRARRFSR